MTWLAGDEITAAKLEKMSNPPRIRLLGVTAQTIPNSTFTAINFTEEVYKVGITHSTSTNTHLVTCDVAGLYMLTGGVYMATNAAGPRALKWQKNGVDIPGSGMSAQPQSGVQTPIVARPTEVQLAVGDNVSLLVSQGSGGNLDTFVSADYARPSMSVRLFRDDSL